MKSKKNGLFISFEGPEASGKSTQIILLKKYLKTNNIKFTLTREPGGTFIAEKLRKIILDNHNSLSASEEIMLLMSSRLNHINEVIKPALSKNELIISDRFVDSTFVYQGYVNKFGMLKAIDLHKKLLDNFLPSKTFLFLLSTNQILKRLKKRKIKNKYDKLDISFHRKVIQGYKKLSYNNSRFINLNALKTVNEIHNKIIEEISNLINT